MDWVKIVYSILLLIAGGWIFIAHLSQKGDERKQFIKTKAQSYAFIVVVGMLILHVGQAIYETVQGESVSGISPLSFLTVISIIYLGTLLVHGKKYGG
jgi:hypothetical protein